MRAWILEEQAKIETRPLKLEEVPLPHTGDDQVRIKVLVCGVCRTDIHIAEGDLPLKKSPVVLGHEIVGVVDEVGKNVKRFSIGDRAGVYWLYSSCKKCKYCLSQRENYCPYFKATGWDEDGGYAEYISVSEDYVLPLNHVQLEPDEIAPLMCPGIAGYAAFKLTEAQKGYKLGLYGFGPTAYFVLKVAEFMGIETYVSTRSLKNIEGAKREGANWAADSSKEKMPCKLDAAIIFPPAGNLVEPALSQLEKGGTLVMAPVSASPIVINNYSENLWGHSIKSLYHVKRDDAEEFFNMVGSLNLNITTSQFPFEELQDVLILVKQGKTEQPNAVIKVAD
ncbi:MAG: alcohol dehydrogenase catalytic domain-containing protein [Deltaproteobacteria bacterium]|nr:alcohol dehydrogenase catalytic domain-containing protein [Deltaproteobacteria bacterium]MBW1737997.1 alcohol dehydrogenase catalytic domain-containing protein [Deltaproteobacteria bacterium]MBW1909383.1 alcohol dehydrogenase catalytic domain-containing protein [Deltaproteobacteria bacterium]MBW2032765.1 alcohol dehydrogenase catalytic domain-containing protein [Deltaproteobacteria bacterium]MBW2115353.1 alcohol dehydrogenase catalytic domain-containing protein [Deltaproteobacteria bacterium